MMKRTITTDGVRRIGPRVEGVLIGCAIGNWGFLLVPDLIEIAGDFSLIIPYGVRINGFPCV